MSTTSSESSGPVLVTRPAARARLYALGVGRRGFEALVAQGDLSLEQIGPRYYVPVAQLDALEARWAAPTQEHDDSPR